MTTDFARDFDKTVNSAKHTAQEAFADAATAASHLKDRARVGLADMAEGAAAATQQARDAAGKLAGEAAHGFADAVETHKTASAEAIASVARSARDAAAGFEKQSPQVARLVRSAADSVERVSVDLRDQSLNDMVKSVADFAQRQPKLFFGFGIAAGFLLSRLLRSSPQA